ncbi:MAG: hypothetical protein QF462_15900, partial [Myxococcota bacterium]|nr:hypothetical protein [Myxococcota bacterium]
LDAEMMSAVAASPCGECIATFIEAYAADEAIRDALGAVVAGLQPPPAYAKAANPWSTSSSGEEMFVDLIATFTDWCTWLPQIKGDQDDGLQYIMQFLWLYYRNNAGVAFVQGRNPMDETRPMPEGFALFNDFAKERGAYMDSPASRTYVKQWLEDPRIEIEDYQKQKVDEYTSWNDFFAREITIDETSRKLKPSQNARAGPEARRPASEGAPARRTPPEVALKHGDSSARAGRARRACSAGASICKQTHLHTDGHGATGNEFPTR